MYICLSVCLSISLRMCLFIYLSIVCRLGLCLYITHLFQFILPCNPLVCLHVFSNVSLSGWPCTPTITLRQ